MKKNKAITYLMAAIIGAATIRSILKYKAERQKEFTDYIRLYVHQKRIGI